MKWSVVASIALASLVRATPVDVEALDLVERAAPKAQFATVSQLLKDCCSWYANTTLSLTA